MSFLVLLFAAIICVVVQTTFLQALPVAWGTPDLVFILVVYAAYRCNWISGLLVVFCAAWMLEVAVSLRLGIYALQCLVVFVFLKAITHKIPIRQSIYKIPLGVLAFILSRLFSFSLASMTGEELAADWNWWPIFRDTLWFMVVAWAFFRIFDLLLASVERFLARRPPMAKTSHGRRKL